MLSPYKIVWDGISSLEFEVLTDFAFDSDTGEMETHLSREAIVSESYNGTLKRAHGYKWSEGFTFTITFIKNDFNNFTQEENRQILKWLTGSRNAGYVDIYKKDSSTPEFCILGNWINVSQYKLGNGRIVGYVAEFESVAPWAFSTLKERTISSTNTTSTTIEVHSDEPELIIYPRLTITHTGPIVDVTANPTNNAELIGNTLYRWNNVLYWHDAEGWHNSNTDTQSITTTSVIVTNTYMDNQNLPHTVSTKVANNQPNEIIILDGANRVISSNLDNVRIFGYDFINWTWLPLIEGNNEISIIGNCTVKLEWREPIKCGEFIRW